MDTTALLVKIGTFMFPLFMSVVGFFLMRLLRSFDDLSKSHTQFKEDLAPKMAVIENEAEMSKQNSEILRSIVVQFEGIKRDIEIAVQSSKDVVSLKEESTILKRDQNSIWKRIDELKEVSKTLDEQTKMLRNRTHWIANKMMIMKSKAEKSGWDFKDEWEWPPK